jgi:hypothetical protein
MLQAKVMVYTWLLTEKINFLKYGISVRWLIIALSETVLHWDKHQALTTGWESIHTQESKPSIHKTNPYTLFLVMKSWAPWLDVNFHQLKQQGKDTSILVLQMEEFISLIFWQATQLWCYQTEVQPRVPTLRVTIAMADKVRHAEMCLGILIIQCWHRPPLTKL